MVYYNIILKNISLLKIIYTLKVMLLSICYLQKGVYQLVVIFLWEGCFGQEKS